jgi:hypothetical protein
MRFWNFALARGFQAASRGHGAPRGNFAFFTLEVAVPVLEGGVAPGSGAATLCEGMHEFSAWCLGEVPS